MSSELKVGIFLVAMVGLAVTFTVFTTPSLHRKGAYAVTFPRVARLKAGDPVTYNGVKVGQVSDVLAVLAKDGSPAVQVVFSVENLVKTKVLVDRQTAYRISQGVLGGAELAILAKTGVPITPEALTEARGTEPAGIDETIQTVKEVIDENRGEIKAAVTSIRTGADNLGSMSAEIRDTVHENREQLKTTVRNVGDAAGSINQVVLENREGFKAAVDNFGAMAKGISTLVEENREAIKTAFANFGKAGTNVADAAKTIDNVVKENRDDLKKAMDGLAKLGARLDKIGENLEIITTQIAQGKGTIGKLVMEDTLHRKTEEVLDRANERLDEVKPFTRGLSELKIIVGLTGGSNTRRGSSQGGALIRIEPKPWKFYQAGVSYRTADADRETVNDDPDRFNIDIDLLFGWRFFHDDDAQRYKLSVAGGLISSQIGGLARWHISDDWSFTMMARQKSNTRQINDRRYEQGDILYRATFEWRVWERVYLVAGADDLEHPGPWFGLTGELLDTDIRNLATAGSLGK